MKNIKLKLCTTLCLLGLGLRSAGAQELNVGRDQAGLKPIEHRYGQNQYSYKLSHSGLNNLNANGITYSGAYESGIPRYNYSLQLNAYTTSYNYSYLLFDYTIKVPAYARAKVKLENSCIHLYNMAYSVTETAAAFYVFDSVDKARNAALVCDPSSTRPDDPDGGKLYYYVYNNAKATNSNGAGVGSTTYNSATTYFDNSTGTTDKDITKGAVFTTCAKKGARYQKGFLLIRPKDGTNTYYTATYDYYKYLTYQSNDGTNKTVKQTIVNSGTMLPASTFTRKNHIFAGWASDKVYAAGASVSANKNDCGPRTLNATWTPVQFTFKNGNATVGSPLSAQSNNSLPTLTDTYKPTSGDKLFVGYFTEPEGRGIQVYNGNLQPTTAGSAESFDRNTTLYAYFISDKHNVIFDYSFRTGETTYATLTDKIYTYRLQFKDAHGNAFKTVNLTAPAATTKETTMSDDISTHTTSNMLVTLKVKEGSESDNLSGENPTIYFDTQAELERVHSFQYDVWNTTEPAGKAEHWETETNESTNTTIFKYTGYHEGNMFTLSWTVTLHDLAMYPEKIYAKPMVKNDGDTFVQISPMNGVTGLECLRTKLESDGSSATYTGEYAVLKTQGSGTAVYKVGMTGFYLDGSDYFLNPTHGTVPDDFVSANFATSESANISYDIHDYDIPVLLLLPAAPNSGITDAKVNHLTKELYVDQARATKVNLSQFVAERPHFNFVGWYDTEWKVNANDEWDANGKNKVWAADADYLFHTHSNPGGGTRTLVALWKRDSKPEASVEMTEEATQFKYTITATDNVEVKAVKYLISSTEVDEYTLGWEEVQKNNNEYVVTIPRDNTHRGQYLYVMVENEGQNVVVKCEEPIRSYFTVAANPNPDSSDTETYADGTWSGEGDNSVFTPNGETITKTYYDYYSTFFYSDRSFILDNATAYAAELNQEGNQLKLSMIQPVHEFEHITIPANTAVILRKEHAEDGTIDLEECDEVTGLASKYEGNALDGVDYQTTQDGNHYYYILSYAQHGLGFYLNNTDKLAAHKAYVMTDKNSQVKAFTFDFSEGDPIVNAIREMEATGKTSVIIDLSGRKVMDGGMQNGVYIKGGHKIMHK